LGRFAPEGAYADRSIDVFLGGVGRPSAIGPTVRFSAGDLVRWKDADRVEVDEEHLLTTLLKADTR